MYSLHSSFNHVIEIKQQMGMYWCLRNKVHDCVSSSILCVCVFMHVRVSKENKAYQFTL